MKVLIGSKALSEQTNDFYREVKDIDYFSDEDVEGAEVFYHPELEKWSWGETATLDELYTIKVSHSFWNLDNGSWNKHMQDISWLQSLTQAKFIPELHEILYRVWENVYGKKKANLELAPDKFFNPLVDRKFEHDSIHESVAYYQEPLFNEILRDDHEVAVSKKKFDNLSQEKKLQLVREEIYATALERHIIPKDYNMKAQAAYNLALMQTIISFSKGWFPLFIVLNYNEIRRPDVNYISKHLKNSHMLRKIEG